MSTPFENADFWSDEFCRMRDRPGHWVNNEIVRNYVYRLISGKEVHWLPWLFHEHFSSVEQFPRTLSICCGDGAHELEMLKTGKVGFLRAFDLSPGAVHTANKRMSDHGIAPERYKIDVQDGSSFEVDGEFDLAFCISAAHHILDLDRMLEAVKASLKPGAPFVLLEFVGPNRFQWTDKQLSYINRLLGTLDPKYLFGGKFTPVRRPTFKEMMRMDPSEAVRSEDVMDAVNRHFKIDVLRNHNGTIIHQLFPALNDDLSNKGNDGFDSMLRLILETEQFLIESGELPSDFVFLICSAK